MYSKFVAGSIIAGAFLFASAYATNNTFAVAGEKLDSGLGALPHYSEWAKHPELSQLVARDTGPDAPAGMVAGLR